MKMQRLHLLAMEEERQSLMDALLQFGRLEIRQTEDLAAEQKARVTYDNILRLSDDPDVSDVIKFLRAREIVHFQRFGEALNITREGLDAKNFYAFNPSIDT